MGPRAGRPRPAPLRFLAIKPKQPGQSSASSPALAVARRTPPNSSLARRDASGRGGREWMRGGEVVRVCDATLCLHPTTVHAAATTAVQIATPIAVQTALGNTSPSHGCRRQGGGRGWLGREAEGEVQWEAHRFVQREVYGQLIGISQATTGRAITQAHQPPPPGMFN